jgi:hypothetical protein
MSNKQLHQCRLERKEGDSVFVLAAWIDLKTAKVGSEVELLPSGEFWTVKEVFSAMPEDVIKETQRQRRAGLPSIRDTKKDKKQAIA